MGENESEQALSAQLGAWTAGDGLRYEALENPSTDLARAVIRGLFSYNTAQTGASRYAQLGVFAYDGAGAEGGEQRRLIASLVGDLVWDWPHIDALWVDEAYRGRGVGGALMRHAEETARTQGIVNTHLETTSFQALPF